MRTFTILSAGAALAALATPASAQVLRSASPGPVSAPAPTPSPTAVSVPAGLPPYVLQTNVLDEMGRPRPLAIEDAVRRYGPDGARKIARDDENRCGILIKYGETNRRIRAAEEEVRLAEINLAQAQTDLDIRIAKERVKQKRRNLLDVLLSIAQAGLGFMIKSPWQYQAMIGVGQTQSLLRQHGNNKTTDLWYETMELFGKRTANYDARLDLYDQRMQLHTVVTEFWLDSMGEYCNRYYPKATIQVSHRTDK